MCRPGLEIAEAGERLCLIEHHLRAEVLADLASTGTTRLPPVKIDSGAGQGALSCSPVSAGRSPAAGEQPGVYQEDRHVALANSCGNR